MFLIKLDSLLFLDPLSLLFLIQFLLLGQLAIVELVRSAHCLLLALLGRHGLRLVLVLRRLSDLLLARSPSIARVLLRKAVDFLLFLERRALDHKFPEQLRWVNRLLHCLRVFWIVRYLFVLSNRFTLD